MEKYHHFYCSNCGAIEDIPANQFATLDLSQMRPGLKAKNYQITVAELCDRCC